MIRLLLASILVPVAVLNAHAQDLKQYLHIRRSYGIVEAVGVPALETLVGSRVCEVQGTIKGSLRTGAKMTLLLERTDGQTMAIDAANIPEWAIATETPARLIIKATRKEDSEELQAAVLAVARDEEVRPVEQALLDAEAKVAAAKRKKLEASRHASSRFAKYGKDPGRTWIVPADPKTGELAAYIYKRNPKLGQSEAIRISKGILGFSRLYGVPPLLIVAMVICESDFNPTEVSRAGAMGLGQLMPETAQDYGIKNPFDSVWNLYGTVREIRSHLDKYRAETGDEFQSLVLGLAAYNAGEGAVKRHGGVPPYKETQSYVRKVIRIYNALSGVQ